jgi:uncharacterized membrane protein YhhN
LTTPLVLAALSALLAILSEERAAGRHRAFYLLKPVTTLLILGAALLAPQADPDYRSWVCLALLLSMLGDIALMFEGEGPFVLGLGSFLVAHLLLVWALVPPTGLGLPPPWTWPPALLALGFFLWLLPRTGALLLPVVVYGITLLAMMLVAALRYDYRGDGPSLWAVAGAMLFLLSDSALAVRQFVGPYPRAQALILSTYWLAVGMIAASVAWTLA